MHTNTLFAFLSENSVHIWCSHPLGAFNEMYRYIFGRCFCGTGELGYDGPLYDGFLHMTDDMLGPSPMHIKYS